MAKAKKTGKSATAKQAGADKAATKKAAKDKATGAKLAETKKPNGKAAEAKASGKAEAKAANGKAAEAKKASNGEAAKKEPKITQAELDALRKPVDEAKAKLDKTKSEAKALTDKAHALVKEAKESYRETLGPYRDACRKAGIECQFEGGRSANVSEKVSFLVERTDKGIRVMVKGQPSTEETIPFDMVKASINKAAYAYTGKHLGPKEEIGNKGGSLGNRIRALLR